MLRLMDSGCERHQPRQIICTGGAAILVGRLLVNLHPMDDGHTYICEHGHTHRLTLLKGEEKPSSIPKELDFAGGSAPVQ